MPINHDAVGTKSDPARHRWTSKDCLLYAVGVGAGAEDPSQELAFTTENSQDVEQRALRLLPILLRGTRVGLARGRDFEETCRRMQMLSAEMGTVAQPGPHGLTIRIPTAGD